jgi:hypothetical protein
MFNKLTTKALIGIFTLLLVIAVFAVLRNNSRSAASRNRTFKSELTDFDSASVNKLIIYPRNNAQSIELSKSDDQWFVNIQDKKYNADPGTVTGMLATLTDLRAIRLAANNKAQWKTYEVTDSAATRVLAYTGKKIVVDVFIGKFSYQQPKNPNPYMQQQGKMTSYVRLKDEKEVYAVDGFLSMSFNRQANDFRSRTIVNSSKDTWTKLTFSGPAEIYNLTRQGERWMIDGLETDSASTAKILGSLARLNSSDFIEASAMESDTPLYTLTIEGENMKAPIKVFANKADTSNIYAISSSLNRGSYFSGSKSDLFSKVFPDKGSFFKNEPE